MSSKVHSQFLRNNVIVGLGNLAGQVQGLLLIPLVVKLSGPTTYGVYVLVSSMLLLAVMLSSLGIGYRYRRYLPSCEGPADRARVFFPGVIGQSLTVGLGSVVLALCFPLFVALFLKADVAWHRLWIPAFCLAYVFYNQACDYFRYTHRMTVFSLAVFVTNTLGLLAYLGLAAAGVALNLTSLFGVQIACNCLVGGLLWGAILRETPLQLQLSTLAHYWDDVRLGFPVVLSSIAETISAVADRYVIGAWYSSAAVGLYAPAVTVGSLILFVPRISGVVLLPLLARATDKSEQAVGQALVRTNVRLFLLVGVPAVAGAAIVAAPVLQLLADARVAAEGRMIVPLITVASLSYGLAMILNGVLFVEKRTKIIFVANVAAIACKVLLSIAALALGFSLVGVAGATLLGAVVALVIVLAGVRMPAAAIIERPFLAKLLAASAVMAGLVVALRFLLAGVLHGAPLLAVLVGAGVVVYGAGLLVLRALPALEQALFRRFRRGPALAG